MPIRFLCPPVAVSELYAVMAADRQNTVIDLDRMIAKCRNPAPGHDEGPVNSQKSFLAKRCAGSPPGPDERISDRLQSSPAHRSSLLLHTGCPSEEHFDHRASRYQVNKRCIGTTVRLHVTTDDDTRQTSEESYLQNVYCRYAHGDTPRTERALSRRLEYGSFALSRE